MEDHGGQEGGGFSLFTWEGPGWDVTRTCFGGVDTNLLVDGGCGGRRVWVGRSAVQPGIKGV